MVKQRKILLTGCQGYVGSKLYSYLNTNTDHIIAGVDLDWYSGPKDLQFNKINFNILDPVALFQFDTVIHLAAHGSVQSVDSDSFNSIKNNCIDFINFINKTNHIAKIIYASSASVYGQAEDRLCKETDELQPPVVEYDKQKQFIDRWAETQFYKRRLYGLRFATVCGYSPNPRNELMINSMVKSAQTQGIVRVTNSDSYRAILGLNDLCRAIYAIIELDGPAGFYNLASFNMQIGEIGKQVSDIFKCNLDSKKGQDKYSFSLDTTKFQETFNFEFRDTVESISLAAANNDFSKVRTWQEMKVGT